MADTESISKQEYFEGFFIRHDMYPPWNEFAAPASLHLFKMDGMLVQMETFHKLGAAGVGFPSWENFPVFFGANLLASFRGGIQNFSSETLSSSCWIVWMKFENLQQKNIVLLPSGSLTAASSPHKRLRRKPNRKPDRLNLSHHFSGVNSLFLTSGVFHHFVMVDASEIQQKHLDLFFFFKPCK